MLLLMVLLQLLFSSLLTAPSRGAPASPFSPTARPVGEGGRSYTSQASHRSRARGPGPGLSGGRREIAVAQGSQQRDGEIMGDA
jgi:hypothetical protein